MNWTNRELGERFQKYYTEYPEIGLRVDLSRMHFDEAFLQSMSEPMAKALKAMEELEAGAIANPDENRMVGHYWLRSPERAPTQAIRQEIEGTIEAVRDFSGKVHRGEIAGEAGPFRHLLLIGIGGSALGPQFVAQALGRPSTDRLQAHYLDNTDPDGMDRVLASLKGELGRTLCVVVSKSGGTKETRNGMIEVEKAYEEAGLKFANHAVAITQEGSQLNAFAKKESWIELFPMWDWVGGRTSVLSAVGLLPAALQGIAIDELLEGARQCDAITRQQAIWQNPAAQLALMWYRAGNGKGEKAMVMLPYKDRLEWFSRYLQQLVMESLGKERDLEGRQVNQGLTVYGNKGSTDQHAFIQQLRDGLPDFFVTFIKVLKDRDGREVWVEPDVTSGDYLHGFLEGTREALFEKGRESITLTVDKVTPFSVGMLIALYERAVGLYASLIGVNAYHQPGVEAGKKAAGSILELQSKIIDLLRSEKSRPLMVEEIGKRLEEPDRLEAIFKICEHLAASPEHGIEKQGGERPFEMSYAAVRR